LTITKASLTITGSSTADKTYDGNTVAAVTTGALSGYIGSETLGVSGSGTFDTKNVGTGKTVTVSYTLADGTNGGLAGNYFLAGENLTAAINKALLTITAGTNTKTYDGTTTAAAIPIITTGTIYGTDSANFSETYDTKDVGIAKTLTAGGAVTDGNSGNNYAYTFVTDTTGVITPTSAIIATFTNESANGYYKDIALGSSISANGLILPLLYDISIFHPLPNTFVLTNAIFTNGRFKELKQFIGYKEYNNE